MLGNEQGSKDALCLGCDELLFAGHEEQKVYLQNCDHHLYFRAARPDLSDLHTVFKPRGRHLLYPRIEGAFGIDFSLLAVAAEDGAFDIQARSERRSYGIQNVFVFFLSLPHAVIPPSPTSRRFSPARTPSPSSKKSPTSSERSFCTRFLQPSPNSNPFSYPRFRCLSPAERSAPVLHSHAQRHAFRVWEHRSGLRVSAIPIFGPYFAPVLPFFASEQRVVLDADLFVGAADLSPHYDSGSGIHRGELPLVIVDSIYTVFVVNFGHAASVLRSKVAEELFECK